MTGIYAALHLLVDGMCALAMFGRLLPRGDRALAILLYNFCAFALQMPLGVALDALCGGRRGRETDFPFLFALAGVLCTVGGAFLHPAVLGIGNALFHVGGGVGTIREDDREGWQGRGLGVFVAPGALGLYLGGFLGRGGFWQAGAFGTGALMALLCACATYRLKRNGKKKENSSGQIGESRGLAEGTETGKQSACNIAIAAVCCMFVVILGSYVVMAVAFPWKSGFPAGLLAVLMVVGGKVAGGFAAARYGLRRTTAISLGLAGICYLCSDAMAPGLAALFLFNMTMPITLYWMERSMPQMPGFAFGFLTFALFLGFLPGYFGAAAGSRLLGFGGSILSMVLLLAGWGWRGKNEGLSGENVRDFSGADHCGGDAGGIYPAAWHEVSGEEGEDGIGFRQPGERRRNDRDREASRADSGQ